MYLDHFKPIYLIFDQFEELFIFGNKPEREDFLKTVRTIIDSDINCRFIFVIREEYLASITEFEQVIPEIMQNRLRIEKMTRANAKQAIEGPCQVAGIKYEETFAETLLEKLAPGQPEVELTYMQVFLDKIYKIASNSLSPSPQGEGRGEVSFPLSILAQLGDVRDLLGSFLEEQISELADPDTGLTMLKGFVSTKGTKRQVTTDDINRFGKSIGKDLDLNKFNEYIQKFVAIRLIRDKDENNRYELRHDALAAKIFEKITLVEKELMEIHQFIENAFANFEKRGVLLTPEDLKYIAPYENKLFLPENLSTLIERSKKQIEKARKRRRNLAVVAVVILLTIFGSFTWWAMNERTKAQEKEAQMLEEKQRAISQKLSLIAKEVEVTDPTKALRLAEQAYLSNQDEKIYKQILKIYGNNVIAEFEIDGSGSIFSPDSKYILTYKDNSAFLFNIQGNFIREFKGHIGDINCIMFSPDGKKILTGSNDKTAIVWDLKGNCLAVLKGHIREIINATFSPDGNNILTDSWEHTRLWDLKGNCIKVIKNGENGCKSIFSPDGTKILIASNDYSLRICDLNGNCLSVLKGHKEVINNVTFSPDGKKILSTSFDKTARLWDLKGNCLSILIGHKDGINSSVFSPDGLKLLTSSFDKTSILWELSGKCLAIFIGHTELVYSAYFSPDGTKIFTSSYDKTIRIWELNGSCLKVINIAYNGNCLAQFSPDWTKIITSSEGGFTRGYDLKHLNLPVILKHDGIIYPVSFSPNGANILTGSSDNVARLWDLQGNCLKKYKAHKEAIRAISFSPDGTKLLTGSFDKTARLWDINGECIQEFKGFKKWIGNTSFSPDGSKILIGAVDNASYLYDTNGKCLAVLNGHNESIWKICFSPDGTKILTGSFDNTARLWDLDGKCIAIFKGHSGAIYAASFSPDGKAILTGSDDNTARLWNLTGKCLAVFQGHEGVISDASFSPDGTKIITVSWDNTARLWNLKGYCLNVFKGHEGWIDYSSFSPDGNKIITVSRDKTIRLWDLSGNCLQIFDGHEDIIMSATFSPDGSKIISGSWDNTARLWSIKDDYKTFKEKDNYVDLNIYDKLKFDLIDFNLVSQSINRLDLELALKFFIEEFNDNTDKNKREILYNKTVFLFQKILKLYPNIKDLMSCIKFLNKYSIEFPVSNNIGIIKSTYQNLIFKNNPYELKSLIYNREPLESNSFLNTISSFEINIINNLIKNKLNFSELAEKLSEKSYELLKQQNFVDGLYIANVARGQDSTLTITNCNFVLSLMLNNKSSECNKIIIQWKDSMNFSEIILRKITELEISNINNPYFAKVKALLNDSTKVTQSSVK